jgi:hypothetical protein
VRILRLNGRNNKKLKSERLEIETLKSGKLEMESLEKERF